MPANVRIFQPSDQEAEEAGRGVGVGEGGWEGREDWGGRVFVTLQNVPHLVDILSSFFFCFLRSLSLSLSLSLSHFMIAIPLLEENNASF